jgi:hypothetical protein
MKVKRAMSLSFIFMVWLSSAMALVQNDFELVTPDAGDIGCILIEEDDGAQEEFRQSINLDLLLGNKAGNHNPGFDAGHHVIQGTILNRYIDYHQRCLSETTALKKCIYLGSLLV